MNQKLDTAPVSVPYVCSAEGTQTEQVRIERTLSRAPDVQYGEVMLAASWCGKGLDNLVPINPFLKLNQFKEGSMLLIAEVFCIGPRPHIIRK